MEAIYLPAVTGQFGNWRYYQLIISVKYLTELFGYFPDGKPNYRVKTVDEVNEIYSSSINDMLQRLFDEKRLEPIRSYLLKQTDRYINNLTISVFGGEPEWLPIGLEGTLPGITDTEKIQEIYKSFGIIKLTGDETLFVLDGQHRIKGLRESIKEDDTLGEQEIAVTFISHNPSTDGKKKTRRLFTTINRYAKPVSLGESILLDEDDLSSIIARKMIEDYPLFKGKDLIALNKEANLTLPKDAKKFTTTIMLWNVNENLIPKEVYPPYEGLKSNLVRIRPKDGIIDEYTKKVYAFWDKFFSIFPKAKAFVQKPDVKTRLLGGPFSLRPIGQQIYTDFYLRALKLKTFNPEDIGLIPDELSDKFWHNVLWNPSSKTITGSKAYGRDYVYYHLGISLTITQLKSLEKNYQKYANDENAKLPKPKYLLKSKK